MLLAGDGDRLGARSRLAHDVEAAGQLEGEPHGRPQLGPVVGEDDAHGLTGITFGRCHPKPQTLEARFQLGRRQRAAPQEALRLLASEGGQLVGLGGLLHALGDGAHPQGVGQAQHARHDGAVF